MAQDAQPSASAGAAPGTASRSETDERPKSRSVSALRGLAPLFRPYRGLVIWAGIMLVSAAVLNLILPVAAGRVVDGFRAERIELMDWYFISALAISAGVAATSALRYYLVTRLGERVITDLRRQVFDKTVAMSPAFYEKVMTGEVLSRLNTDTTLLLSVVSSSVSVALRNSLLLVGGLILMTWTSPKLAAYALLIVPAVILPIRIFGLKVRRLSRLSQAKVAQSTALASETLLAAQTVQAYTAEPQARAAYGELIEEAYEANRQRIAARAVLTAAVILLVFSAVVGVLWIGAADLRAGQISAGQLVQFLIYAVLVAGAAGSLSEVWGEIQRAAGATERLMELLRAEDPLKRPASPRPPASPARGEIRFDGVDFHYPSRPDAAALKGVDLKVNPGETVALVGPSGAGKSTVFQLLLRYYDPESGRILLDGVPAAEIAPEVMRRSFAVVSQEPAIFADTVAGNIAFGIEGGVGAIGQDRIEAAARAAAAHEFIEALPEGYATPVGERGVLLSGGQKQRLAIARAILRDAPVLLLDEATSALDAQSERLVQQAVDRLSETRTTLVIAHRLATVKRADRIVVMDAGQVVAEGTHDSLVREDGLYAHLARLQFSSD